MTTLSTAAIGSGVQDTLPSLQNLDRTAGQNADRDGPDVLTFSDIHSELFELRYQQPSTAANNTTTSTTSNNTTAATNSNNLSAPQLLQMMITVFHLPLLPPRAPRNIPMPDGHPQDSLRD